MSEILEIPEPAHEISVSYNGNTIYETDVSDTFKLKTAGKLMSDDVLINATLGPTVTLEGEVLVFF